MTVEGHVGDNLSLVSHGLAREFDRFSAKATDRMQTAWELGRLPNTNAYSIGAHTCVGGNFDLQKRAGILETLKTWINFEIALQGFRMLSNRNPSCMKK